MKYIVKTTAMALIGGLFTAGLVLAADTKAGTRTEGQQQNQPEATPADPKGPMQQTEQAPTNQQNELRPSAVGQHQASAQMDARQVRELQSALNEKGYAVGSVDGVYGPKTSAAIREFQSKEGLSATGQLDQQTLKALGIDVGQQEFMGVSPEFGEDKEMNQPEATPAEPREQTEQPGQPMERQPSSPGTQEYK